MIMLTLVIRGRGRSELLLRGRTRIVLALVNLAAMADAEDYNDQAVVF